MKHILARFLLTFMLMWLPVQAYAVQSMPFCQTHRHHHASVLEHQHMGHQAMHGACHEQRSHIDATPACDDCANCQVFFQPALMLAPLVLAGNDVRLQPGLVVRTFTPVFPDQPHRPPLPLFS